MRNLPCLYFSSSIIPDHKIRKWKSRAAAVKDFKNYLDIILARTQDTCCYCGLMIGKDAKRRKERDHFAPDSVHSEFRFLPMNIVLSCSVCNGLETKRDIDTITGKEAVYEDCTFSIIHPRLDDIHEHIEFVGKGGNIPLVKNASQKGQSHISLFDLDHPVQISLRASEKLAREELPDVEAEVIREKQARGL